MSTVLQDVRYAIRALRQARAFTILAVVTIALGIGANTAVFSVVNGVLLRRLPFGANDRLITLHQPSATQPDVGFSVLEKGDYQRNVPELAAVSEYHSMPFDLYGRGEPRRVVTGVVSDNYFDLLGVQPLLGRLFTPGEEAVGAAPVIVVSYSFWKNQLGGDPSIVGARFTMNDHIHTVVGVLPPLPPYPNANDIWMPAGACPFRSNPQALANRQFRLVRIFAALKPGVSVEKAQQSVNVAASRMHAASPEAYSPNARLSTTLATLRSEMTQGSRPLFVTLLITAAFVLLVATANFASLTLSRQLQRQREITLRNALGASRGRLLRQLVTENLCVSFVGGLFGIAVAFASLGILRTLAARVTPRASEISIDPVVLAVAILLSIVVGVVAAVIPFARSVPELAQALRSGGAAAAGPSRAEGRMRGLLVGAQVAVAVVVLVAAGLLTRSLIALERTDAGYEVENVMTASISLNWSRYTNRGLRYDFAERLRQRLAGQPEARVVAISTDFPLNNPAPNSLPFQIRSQPAAPGATPLQSSRVVVSSDYFKAVGVPVLRGRAFDATDRDTVAPPVIISKSLADRHWKGDNPIGDYVNIGGQAWRPIVGVVGNVRQNAIAAGETDMIYLPFGPFAAGLVQVLVRTDANPSRMAERIRVAVRELDANQPIFQMRTLEELRGVSLAQPRETAALVSAFAALALLITAGGLAGVVGYSVSQRVNEIGVRVALGASASSVLRTVTRNAMLVTAGGLAAGIGIALGVSRFLQGLLYGVTPVDALTFVAVSALLLGVALAACLVPARAALRIDPIVALKGR